MNSNYQNTEIGQIPSDWQVIPLLRAIKIQSGQVDPKKEPFSSMVLVAPDHVQSETGRLLEKETAKEQGARSGKYQFFHGNIVYSKIRPYLRKAILASFDGLCSADMYSMQTSPEFHNAYIFYNILDRRFSRFTDSVSLRTGIPKINREELGEYKIQVPPSFEEQKAIAEVLSDTDALIESLERLIEKKEILNSNNKCITHCVNAG